MLVPLRLALPVTAIVAFGLLLMVAALITFRLPPTVVPPKVTPPALITLRSPPTLRLLQLRLPTNWVKFRFAVLPVVLSVPAV